MKNISQLLVYIVLLSGCSSKHERVEYTMDAIAFSFDGPLYSGPNTAQAELEFDLKDILQGRKGVTQESIQKVELISADLYTDSTAISGINSFVVQMTSEQSSMVQAAVLNPVPVSNTAALNPSSSAELRDIFRQSQFIALLDADISEDMDTSFVIYGNFTFAIDYK